MARLSLCTTHYSFSSENPLRGRNTGRISTPIFSNRLKSLHQGEQNLAKSKRRDLQWPSTVIIY